MQENRISAIVCQGGASLFYYTGVRPPSGSPLAWVLPAKGDPGGCSDLAWPAFSASSNQRMQFDLRGPSIVSNFHATECAYWISTYESAFGDPNFKPSL